MKIEDRVINNLRLNCANMVENAGSGHLGTALGIMPTLFALYSKHMKVVPNEDKHYLRDRFVMSNGHGASALYAVLNAMGFNISIDDLKNYRSNDTITPGHPSIKTPGVDCSTGPLGQGVAMAVGMAIAEQMLAERVNSDSLKLVDNYTYCLLGDGCLMEGVSYEALSLAGTLKLNKFIAIYDNNKFTIDGKINEVCVTNVKQFAASLGFDVIEVKDGNDFEQIDDALSEARKSTKNPVFIIVNTTIGYGTLLENTQESHSGALGEKGMLYLKQQLNITSEAFKFDKDVNEYLKENNKRFKAIEKEFDEKIKFYKKNYASNYDIFDKFYNGKLTIKEYLDNYKQEDGFISTRDFSGQIVKYLTELTPNFIGGSADLRVSTRVNLSKHTIYDSFKNNEIKYGVREFAMASISNGLALYGFRPFCSTFLVFSDYMKNAIRMSALMNNNVTYILTHDGVSMDYDGDSHQAIEQLMGLRLIPNLKVFRPCDFNETKACYVNVMANGPSAMVLSKLKSEKVSSNYDGALKGGYVLRQESRTHLDMIIIATGSEVKLAVDLAKELEFEDRGVRVVSMPCWEVFDKQPKKYKEEVLPKGVLKMSLEAGSTLGWQKYVDNGICIGIDEFGHYGDSEHLYKEYGFDVKKLLKTALNMLKKSK